MSRVGGAEEQEKAKEGGFWIFHDVFWQNREERRS